MIVKQLLYACECDLCRKTVSAFVTSPEGHHYRALERAAADGWRKVRFPVASLAPNLPVILRDECNRFVWLACPKCLAAYEEWLEEVAP